MFNLMIAVILGIFFAIFASQNTGPVTLNFGDRSLENFPIYLAILLPLLLGLLVGFFGYVLKDLTQDMTASQNRERIKNLKKEIAEVTHKAHKLQIENEKFKKELGRGKDENSI